MHLFHMHFRSAKLFELVEVRFVWDASNYTAFVLLLERSMFDACCCRQKITCQVSKYFLQLFIVIVPSSKHRL